MTDHTIEDDPGTERIDIRERYETQLWMQALDIDEGTLRKAVSEAGTNVENVRKYLLERLRMAKISANLSKRPAKRALPARRPVRSAARRKTSR